MWDGIADKYALLDLLGGCRYGRDGVEIEKKDWRGVVDLEPAVQSWSRHWLSCVGSHDLEKNHTRFVLRLDQSTNVFDGRARLQ